MDIVQSLKGGELMHSVRAWQMISCLVSITLLVSPSLAQQVNGTWVLAVELDAGSGGEAMFVLAVEDGEISGSYTGALGEDIPVTGKVTEEGATFSFDSQAGEVFYEGKIEENTMEGTCEYGQLGPGTFKGEREQ
tara:strand:- start:2696 stop:3100 length:405 start_codon:yes stop_codon:yes gene_type:complete